MIAAAARAAAAVALVALPVAFGTGCRPPVQGNGRSVLLISLETTRADHLGLYGYGRPTSPRLDAFARQGIVFDNLSTVSPRTNPSLASLMTSRYPHEHGVRNLLLPLEPENRTLAEVLRAAGYTTAAVQTHPRLVASSGFAQGFGEYADAVADHPLAPQAVAAALRLIEQAEEDRPWFLWLHLMDPHWTYDPPGGGHRFGPDDPRPAALYRALRSRQATIGPVIFQNRMPASEVQAFIDLYDAEIRYTDEAIGMLLERLDPATAVVVTADHGESLGENDYFFEHGDLGSQPEVHIPLVLRAPGLPAGRRIRSTVATLDVAPTILDLVGLRGDGSFRGTSLLPLLSAEADRPCFGETDQSLHEEADRRAVRGLAGKWRWLRRGNFKLLHKPQAGGPPRRELYDLSGAGDGVDVSAQHPHVAHALARELDAWLAEDRGQDRQYHISDEAEEILRSLGYVN